MNTAARLQAAAPVNGVLVGERTFRETREVIEYRAARPVAAKGKRDPVPVWEAVQARARLGARFWPAARTALVGRDRELGVLRDALARVRAERSPQLVTLVGVPGIGKSRLVYELWRLAEADGADLLAAGPLAAVRGGGQLLGAGGDGQGAGGHPGERHLGQAGAKLAAMAAEVVRRPGGRGLGAAAPGRAGRPGPSPSGAGPVRRRPAGEAFAAWRQFVEALAESRPLVLVFEDLHWADDGLLDFVDYLADWADGVPLLVVGSARPELLDRRPGWGGGKPNAITLSLAPLSDEDTARLIGSLMGRPVLEAGQQAALLARAGGNPLYAEQYVQMLAERGAGPSCRCRNRSRASSRPGWTCWPRPTSGCCRTPR